MSGHTVRESGSIGVGSRITQGGAVAVEIAGIDAR